MKIKTAKHDPEQIEVTLTKADMNLVGVTSITLWYDEHGRWLYTARANTKKKTKAALTVGNDVLIKALSLASPKVAEYTNKIRMASLKQAAAATAATRAAETR